VSNLLFYPPLIESAIARIEALIRDRFDSTLSPRSLALLLLQNDPETRSQLQGEPYFPEIEAIIRETQANFTESLSFAIAESRHNLALAIAQEVTVAPQHPKAVKYEWLHHLTVHPLTGIPLLLLILYFGIYQFVGVFGGGTLVDSIEGFFEAQINPQVDILVAAIIPWPILQDLFAHDYGIITLGLRYAIAIVLPIVTTFFLMFSCLEDSGYLPRLSLLVDRIFKTMGLSGRSIIPLILGLGCGTMATLVTRTLESKRERVIATLLLALTVPCSAQLGVILALLSQEPVALFVWTIVMLAIFVGIGFLAGKAIPGESTCFYMEIPPLRIPRPQAILTKTYVRLKWYFGEVLPLFILASVLIWIGKITGLFGILIKGLEPIVTALGLPKAAAPTFLYGFFRRDYGAAGMFDLHDSGILSSQQLVVAAVTLTLFMPCIAQLQFMFKERGIKTTIAIASFVILFAFSLGYGLNQLLTIMELSL